MKLLVVSDNHGDKEVLVSIFDKYQHEVDAMFHCGDSELTLTDSLWDHFFVVRGNCDYDADFPETFIKKYPDETVFMTHGHLINVRSSLTNLALKAKENQATIALFGHTHILGCEYHQGILFLNPGSIRLPRGPVSSKTYAIIETSDTHYFVQYYNEKHEAIPSLSFHFEK